MDMFNNDMGSVAPTSLLKVHVVLATTLPFNQVKVVEDPVDDAVNDPVDEIVDWDEVASQARRSSISSVASSSSLSSLYQVWSPPSSPALPNFDLDPIDDASLCQSVDDEKVDEDQELDSQWDWLYECEALEPENKVASQVVEDEDSETELVLEKVFSLDLLKGSAAVGAVVVGGGVVEPYVSDVIDCSAHNLRDPSKTKKSTLKRRSSDTDLIRSQSSKSLRIAPTPRSSKRVRFD